MSEPVDYRDANDQVIQVAGDQVAGLGRVQIIKLAIGADGTATLLSDTDRLPVQLPSSTDATLAALQAANDQMRELADTFLIVAQAMLDRLPRITSNDQMAVSIEAGAVGIAAAQTLATVTTVNTVTTVTGITNLANVQQLGARPLHGETLMNAGLTTIYDNLVRT
jgi:hypothetical protein